MTRIVIKTLPAGSRGFDCNRVLIPEALKFAREVVEDGSPRYDFGFRYLRRSAPNSYDLSAGEVARIMESGLALGLVQHVAPEPWLPSSNLGITFGSTAALDARRCGIPHGAELWCDLEGVSPVVSLLNVTQYVNRWSIAVRDAGYLPGLYVGANSRLTARQLYYTLNLSRYWAAYNLDADEYPLVRGVCLRQRVAHASEIPVGYSNQNFDCDTVQKDSKGDLPLFVVAE